jgi:hypothetical protein
MKTAARYRKGCEMLERYEGKLSRTVLRRGGASNRTLLSLLLFTPEITKLYEFYEMRTHRNFRHC